MNRDRAYLKKMIPEAVPDGPAVPEKAKNPPRGRAAATGSVADAVAGFIGRYLACDDQQLTVLALWAVYTWCFEHFFTAVYLEIRSPEPESGKSLCLELLELLCDSPWLTSGADPRTIGNHLLTAKTRIHPGEEFVIEPPYTVLLDDCHHAFHGSERQPLVALLNSGARASGKYSRYLCEYRVFGPKAFAGNAPLPSSLASRCIPVVLQRKRPAQALARLHGDAAREGAERLLERLSDWAEENGAALAQTAEGVPAGIPPGLSPREQECAEPLLHIADCIGGEWPEKARTALAAVFNLEESRQSLQMLSDVRTAFISKGDPEHLTTRDLLAAIGTLEHRPWSGWGRHAARRLSAMLQPFGITSRSMRAEDGTVLRGYRRGDFQEAWERYLRPAHASAGTTEARRKAKEKSAANSRE